MCTSKMMKALLCLSLLICNNLLFGESSSQFVQDTCTPTSAGDSSIDDVPSISKALSTCGNRGTIIIPAGKTFSIRSPLDFSNCKGCNFQIEGTLKTSDDIEYWKGKTAFFLLQNVVGGSFSSVTGSGVIDGSGQAFWDYFASHKEYQRPLLLFFNGVTNVTFTNIKLMNPPTMFVTVKGNSANVKLSNLVLTAISKSANPPKNTDGFDIGECSNVTLTNMHVTNGDDCVAFENGANYVTVENFTCIGSHGISVGSLGGDAGRAYIVQNVYVSNAKMINCAAATRIKFYPGGPSHGTVAVHNVTYKDITVDNSDYALQIDNCYATDTSKCKEHPSAAKLSNIRFININGKTSKQYEPIVAKIECPPKGTCDIAFTKWDINAPRGKSTVLCSYYDHPSGIKCTPGVSF